jgi:hypothetical protein
MSVNLDPLQTSLFARTMGAMSRRDLLLAFIGLCTGTLACTSHSSVPMRLNSEALGEWLREAGAGFFPDLAALRRLGTLYLAAHPEERSGAVLARLLIAGEQGTIPSRLLRAIARDWSSHHVAVVDGWLLARTEARLCAVLHLEEGTHA